jgi:peptidoglycan DL-endopeptidase CwlO
VTARLRGSTSDHGGVQAVVAATVALLAVPVMFVAALFNAGTGSGLCHPYTPAQPHLSADALADIPANYLRLYQETGQRLGLPWHVLAAVGKIESDHGRDPDPDSGIRSGANSAGAAGPMQIGVKGKATNNWGGTPRHPAHQRTGGYGTDGNGDGWADVHDPADAIPAAARYLLANGAPAHLEQALFAYNPSAAYVRTVIRRADRYSTKSAIPEAAHGSAAGCTGDATAYATVPDSVAAKALSYAHAQIGKPYVWGAEGPDSFDCSGLTMMAYRAAGIIIPRVAADQWRHGRKVPKGDEQPGDLIFMRMTRDGPGHVGIVTGQGQMINAPRRGDVVRTASYHTHSGVVGFVRPAAGSELCRFSTGMANSQISCP